MNISIRWLEAFFRRPLDPADVAQRLTMLGAPVDAVEPLHTDLGELVVGLVEEVRQHPNADRLRVCLVNDGTPDRRHVRRPADDVESLGSSVIHQADAEAVGIRMRADFLDEPDDEVTEIGVERLDRIHRGAEHREPVRHVLRVERATEERLEPAEGDVHACPATRSRNRISPSSNSRISGTP